MTDYEKTMEELLRCPVCQDVLDDPRQLPCGHSLCLRCLEHLRDSSSGAAFRCPCCQKDYWLPIDLHKSYTLSSIAEDFRQNKRESALVVNVACDCCRGKGQPAVKSCLKCEVSLCKEHVKDHEQLSAFRRHPLVNAVADLSKRKCPKHEDEVLLYYCKASRRYLCVECGVEKQQQEHLSAACAGLLRTLTEKINTQFFALRTQLVDYNQSIRDLQNILQRNNKEKVTSLPFSCVTMAMLPLLLIVLFYAYHFSVENKRMQDTVHNQQKHMDRIFSSVTEILKYQPMKMESLEAMDSEGYRRLDLDTVHNLLQVSNDLQTVERVATKINYPSGPTRFTEAPQVLSTRCFSTGVHAWQVLAEGYWDIAVSYRSIDFKSRRGSTFGNNPHSWSLTHNSHGKLFAYHNADKTVISGSLHSKLFAVMVDIEGGNITFASVGPTVTRLHEFKAKLTEPVCLGLGLYRVSPASRATVLTAS